MSFPPVDVAVAVISDAKERHLWVWNPKWGAFALPMTKPRGGPAGDEEPARAALRAGAEALGVPARVLPGTVRLPLRHDGFSGRQWAKRAYNYEVFGVEAHPDFAGRQPPGPHLWLSPAQALEAGYEPLSPSSREIVHRVLFVFPPDKGVPMRRSRAALAVIGRRDEGGGRLWLAQWNPKWQRFHFVGGHRNYDETFRQCLVREVAEELRLTPGTDFVAEQEPLARAEYVAHSESAGQDTRYEMELYQVRLLPTEAVDRAYADPLNRWLSADEIRAGRTTGGQPVNESMARLLDQAGWPCP